MRRLPCNRFAAYLEYERPCGYNHAMEMHFTKRDAKNDDLTIVRSGGATETIACPKQGIIPHDMVHYAVENVLCHRGFLSLVDEGQSVAFAVVDAGDSEEAVERLVETFQAEMWGGQVAAEDLLATYAHACGARGHGVATISLADVAAIRDRLDALSAEWAAIPLNGTLSLTF